MAGPKTADRMLDWLTTRVLENIAALSSGTMLRGQAVPSRASRRRRFPKVEFYGNESMPGGLPGHRHSHPELATVLDGQLNLGIGGRVYRARAGDWLVFPAHVPHGECCLESRASYRLLWFIPTPPRFGIHLTRYSRSRGYEMVSAHRFGDIPHEVLTGMRRLCGAPWDDVHEVRRELLKLVLWCLDRLRTAAAASTTRPHPLVVEIQTVLRGSLARPLGVVELANRVGLSPNYLSNLFHRQTGRTIRQFVQAERIERARRELADPGRSLKQVAYGLGFVDPHHFSHVFRRVAGVSPTSYRQSVARHSS